MYKFKVGDKVFLNAVAIQKDIGKRPLDNLNLDNNVLRELIDISRQIRVVIIATGYYSGAQDYYVRREDGQKIKTFSNEGIWLYEKWLSGVCLHSDNEEFE